MLTNVEFSKFLFNVSKNITDKEFLHTLQNKISTNDSPQAIEEVDKSIQTLQAKLVSDSITGTERDDLLGQLERKIRYKQELLNYKNK